MQTNVCTTFLRNKLFEGVKHFLGSFISAKVGQTLHVEFLYFRSVYIFAVIRFGYFVAFGECIVMR
jgi:hypothetical protein